MILFRILTGSGQDPGGNCRILEEITGSLLKYLFSILLRFFQDPVDFKLVIDNTLLIMMQFG